MKQARARLPARHSLALIALGLAVYGLASRWIGSPGYMDADYYFATGAEIRAGEGLTEPFLWNYLDDPAGIPHPSHLYWMPLPSLVAAAGLSVLGSGFRAAQAPFVLLAAVVPALVANLAFRLDGDRRRAWLSGLLAAFPGFYLPFLVTTDAFAIYLLAAGLCLWSMATAAREMRFGRWAAAGALAGLANLARADAPLLLVAGLICILVGGKRRFASLSGLLLGYLLLISPWWARNLIQTGSILNPGSARLFWMTGYDDLFSYPGGVLNLDRWQMAGLAAAVSARLSALGTNLQRLIAENGLIFMGPLAAVGAWQRRDHPYVRLLGIYLGLLLTAMTIVYPFIGSRGGLFHSATALMPGIWMLTPIGLDRAVRWLGMRRAWNLAEATRVFSSATVGLAMVLTAGLFAVRQILPAASAQGWDAPAQTYRRAASELDLRPGAVVAVNNPPGFFIQSGHPAIVIPNGGPDTLREVVTRYGAGWVVLESNHPAGLEGLYQHPDSIAWVRLEASLDDPSGQPLYILRVLEP